ncbi:hypothetical protein C8J56DRAFT_1040606 [Mycena floridula]|nr:hypothetical protein C8J56DRAFT_1040606 [Mycena floridula]
MASQAFVRRLSPAQVCTYWCDERYGYDTVTVNTLFKDTPSLRALDLKTTKILLPRHHLETVTVRCPKPFAFLSQCSDQLTSVRISGPAASLENEELSTNVLSNLSSMTIEWLEYEGYRFSASKSRRIDNVDLLNHLTLPALTALSLVSRIPRIPLNLPTALISLFSRSACNLTRFSLTNIQFSSDKFISLLFSLSSLSTLCIANSRNAAEEDTVISIPFFERLGETSGAVLLPNLEVLETSPKVTG